MTNPLWQTALWVWIGWFRSELVQILPNQPNNLCSLQRADIRNRFCSLRHATGIGARSNHLHSLRGRSHQHSRQTRFCCSLLRRRPPDLRPLAPILLLESGGANVELCRRDRRMDGQQSTQAQPFKDGADLAWIFSAAEALPSWWTQHRWGIYPSSRLRTSVTSVSWLTMICRYKFTSATLHELVSTICVNCELSGVLSWQTRPTPWFEFLCTVGSTTAMELSPVCFSTRSIGFNLSFVPRHALSSAYPSGPAFRTPCTTNYTGSPSQKGSSSNSVDCLQMSTQQRTPVSVPILHTGHLAPWSFTPEICSIWWSVCTSHLHQDNRTSWILPCWSNSLELSSS